MAQQAVTDPKEIERLNALFSTQTQQTPVSSSVTDPALIAALNERYALQNAQEGTPASSVEVKEPPAPKEENAISKLYSNLEVPFALASSAGAGVAGGLAGLSGLMLSGDVDTAIKQLEATQGALTYTPRTQRAQDVLSTIGETLAPVGEVFESVSRGLGDVTMDITGSPLAATIAYTAPTAAAELLGLKGIKASRNLGISDPEVGRQIRETLQDPINKYNSEFAFVKVDPKNQKIVPDQTAIDLASNGFNRGSVSVITKTEPENKQIMLKMLDDFEASQENDIYKATRPAASEIGNAVTGRLNRLKMRRADLGKQLDSFVKGDSGKVEIDLKPAVSSFLGDLFKQYNVKVKINSKGVVSLADEGVLSEFPSLRKIAESTINLYNQSHVNGVTSVKRAHDYKKLIDELEDVNKAEQAGLSGTMHRKLLDLRSNINNTIRESSPEYASINDNLSSTIQAMRPWEKYLQPGQTWDKDLTKNVIESALNSLGKDSKTSQEVTNAVVSLDKSMKDMGYDLKDNPVVLLEFKRILEDNFSLDPETISKSIGKADNQILSRLTDAGISLSMGNKFAVAHDVASLVSLGMKKSEAENFLKSKQKARELLRKALSEQ